MFKTILKAVALSATALTLLSACGAATRAFDDFVRVQDARSDAAGAGTALASGSPDCYYVDKDIDCNLDPRLCDFNCPLSAAELLNLKAQFIEEEGLGYEYELYHHVSEDDLRASAAKLEGDERIRADAFIADFVASKKTDATRRAAAHLESEIKKTSLSEEQTRWQKLELWNVKNEPATTAPHAVSVTVASVTPAEDGIRRNRTVTKTNTTFSLVLGIDDTAIMTINGVDYEIMLDSYYSGSSQYISNPNGKVSNNRATLSSRGNNIRRVVHGIHPTVQGDYFTYRTNTDGGDYYDNDNYIKGVATMGIQTDAAVAQSQTAVAIYRGEGSLNAYESTYSDSIVGLAITMSVDFDANTIQGTGMETYYDGSHFNHSPANMTFNSAPIVGNGFSGTFTMNSELRERYRLTDNPTGQYSGNFFGPKADDLAGVMQFNGTTDYNSEITRIGGFRADRTVIQGFEE